MAELVQNPLILVGEGWADYGLIDSGDGRKLERYGPHRFIRPESQALWMPKLERWASDGEFVPASTDFLEASTWTRFAPAADMASVPTPV
jgi:23S rRNA (cytosine1962-C5)-methyltransferase